MSSNAFSDANCKLSPTVAAGAANAMAEKKMSSKTLHTIQLSSSLQCTWKIETGNKI